MKCLRSDLLLGVLLLAPALWAQPAHPLSPAEALDLARQHGPLVPIARARRLLAEGRGRTDASWPNPIAEWRRENYDSPLEPDVFATLQVPLDITGRRLALRSAATAATARGRADSAHVAREFEAAVLRAYWRTALASELLQIAQSEYDARRQTAAFDTQRFREGAVAEVAAMRTQLEADRARAALASAEAERARAAADLARLLGVPLERVSVLESLQAGSLDTLPSVDTAWAQVRERRPDLAAARHSASEMQRRWRAERRGVVGDISVVGGYKGTSGYSTGLFGVLVPLPLFNRNEGPRQRSQGEYLVSQAELMDLEFRAKGEVHAASVAWATVASAGRQGVATLSARATEVAQIAEAAYREGATSLMDLIEAQRARADARATSARWMADVALARLDLNRATGAPLLTH